jgi:hypothetical protein
MKSTIPVFILGSGRSGTFQMVKLLEAAGSVEAHHEYLFESTLKPAVLHRMGAVDKASVKSLLTTMHKAAVHYSEAAYWVDSSNALPWIVEPLYETFPDARFIHLLRDGRKVVSSFYNKFTEVMYDDRSVGIVNDWLADPTRTIEPPAEKKYWRPFPMPGEPFAAEFPSFDRFQRLCYYWQDCNLRIKRSLEHVPAAQQTTLYLEDVVSQQSALEQFLSIFDLNYDQRYMDMLKRPVNVHIPKNFPFTETQYAQFEAIAGDTMRAFGYHERKEYEVEY